MKNAKASNAVLAVADAMADMASDYEGQIQELHRLNKAMAAQVKQDADERQSAKRVGADLFQYVLDRIVHTSEMPPDELRFCEVLIGKVKELPWPMPNFTPSPRPSPSGSSGVPTTFPTSSAATPNG